MIRKLFIKYFIVIIAWLSFSYDCLYSQNNDSLIIHYCYIDSYPQNASVYLNDSLIGCTPIRFFPSIIDTSKIVQFKISLEGYYDYILNFEKGSQALKINKTISLIPKSERSAYVNKDIAQKNEESYFKTPRKIIPITVCGVITAGSGVLSYYFKQLANDRYDDYLNTGDASYLDKKHKYDVISGVSLVLFQAGLAGVIYFLLIK
jgi:hypothetical protein